MAKSMSGLTDKQFKNELRKGIAVNKAKERVLLLAERWANHVRQAEVLSSPSHHLLRAIDKLAELEEAP